LLITIELEIMRFHTPSSPPPYFNRRDQRRLLAMVALLCLILVAARLSSRAKFWHWLFPADGNSSRSTAPSQPVSSTDRPPRPGGTLEPDEFRVSSGATTREPGPAANPQQAAKSGEANRRPATGVPPGAADGAGPTDANALLMTTTIGPQFVIRPQLLTEVRDSRLGLRRSEAEAYFTVLATIRDLPPNAAQGAALRGVTYTAMMASPAHYRGRLIQMQGEVKRISAFTASDNSHNIVDLYDVWFLTSQSGDKPLHARCTHMPVDIVDAVRQGQTVRMRITGYFFRIEAYSAVGGVRTAPLILAHSLRWIRPPAETRSQRGLVPYVIGFVTLVSLASGLTIWMYKRSDDAFEHSHLKRLSEPQAPVVGALQEFEITTPNELFRDWSSEIDDPAEDAS